VITGNPPKNECHHVTYLYLAFVALKKPGDTARQLFAGILI
jgi:hypothetical protein